MALAICLVACGDAQEPSGQQGAAEAPRGWPEFAQRTDGRVAYSVAGVVVNGEGQPFSGARVRLREGFLDVMRGGPHRRTTDEGGHFRFDMLSEGPCEISASAKGYAVAQATVGTGDGDVVLTLHRPAVVAGRVLDREGNPTRARIVRISDGPMHPGSAYMEDDVGESGRFEYRGREPGPFHIRAVTENGDEADLRLDLKEGAEHRDTDLKVASPWRSFVVLQVVETKRNGGPDESAESAAVVPVPREQLWFGATEPRPRVEAADGAAVLAFREAPGTPVWVRVCRNDRPAIDFETRTHESRKHRPKRVAVRERVLVNFVSRPRTPKLHVELWHADFEEWDRTGAWLLSPDCRFDLRVRAAGYVERTQFGRSAPETGGEVVIPLDGQPRTGSVRGRLLGPSAEDTAKARVLVGQEDRSVKAEPDGSFVVNSLAPGRRVLCFEVEHFRIAAIEVNVAPGGALDVGEVLARSPRRLRGVVVDEEGRPIGGAFVQFVARLRGGEWHGDGCDRESTYSHIDGRFELKVPGVDGDLIVGRRGFGTTPFEFAGSDRRPLRLVLPMAATIRVVSGRLGPPRGYEWTFGVRWPLRAPHAIWNGGDFLPDEVEVAPGTVEILPQAFELSLGPAAQLPRMPPRRRVECRAGETVEVVLER